MPSRIGAKILAVVTSGIAVELAEHAIARADIDERNKEMAKILARGVITTAASVLAILAGGRSPSETEHT